MAGRMLPVSHTIIPASVPHIALVSISPISPWYASQCRTAKKVACSSIPVVRAISLLLLVNLRIIPVTMSMSAPRIASSSRNGESTTLYIMSRKASCSCPSDCGSDTPRFEAVIA